MAEPDTFSDNNGRKRFELKSDIYLPFCNILPDASS
jgi:hypothetical protein